MQTTTPAAVEEGKIVVAVRCRPFNERERTLKAVSCIDFQANGLVIYEKGVPKGGAGGLEAGGKHHAFAFDFVYPASVPQEKVFTDIGEPVLASSWRGFNTCIFAYGQTGSGKSYAMMGPGGGRDSLKDPGIIPRLCTKLFDDLQHALAESNSMLQAKLDEGASQHELPPKLEVVVEVSYLEIYQEKVKCLLAPGKENLKVRQHVSQGIYVEGLTDVPVTTYDKVLDLIDGGNNARAVAATNMNERSSRSHAIFTISLTQKRTSRTKEGMETKTELKAKINLVDLAGSERAKSTGADGDTLREGANINKSLTVLGLVISGLAELSKFNSSGSAAPGKAPFIPYRDSMLTYLLKESLGGNSKTFMLSTLSPAHINYEETLSTLRYADRAKSIVTKACINESASDRKIRQLEDEVAKLRQAILEFQAKQQKSEEVAKVVPPLNLASVRAASSSSPSPFHGATRGKMPVQAVRGSLAQRSKVGLMTPRSAINRVLVQDDDTLSADGEFYGEDDDGDAVGPTNLSLARMQAQLEQDMTLLEKANESKEHAEERAQLVLQQLQLQTKTVKATTDHPYLMNVDNAGDWLVEVFTEEVMYLGTEAIDKHEDGQPALNTRCIIVSGDEIDGIGPQHCCFIRLPNGSYALRPLEGYSTYLNNDEEAISGDVTLSTGARVCIGDNFVEFKYVDPSQQGPQTSRRRGQTTAVRQGSGLASGPGSPTAARPPDQTRLGDSARASPLLQSAHSSPPGTPPPPASPPAELEQPPTRPLIPALRLGLKPSVPPLQLPGRAGVTPPANTSPQRQEHSRSPSPVAVAPASRPPVVPSLSLPSRSNNPSASPALATQAHPSLQRSAGLMSARPAGSSTPRAGTVHLSSMPREEVTTAYRHLFVFLGRTRSGKTTLRQCLAGADEKWYSGFFKKTLPPVTPTFGVDLSKVETGTIQRAQLTLVEVAGCAPFNFLLSLLPDKRVSYVLCVSLVEEAPSLETVRDFLEFIVAHSPSSETTLVIVATHLEDCKMSNSQVVDVLSLLEEQVNGFLATFQPLPERRPRVVGKFAVGCRERTVVSPSSRLSKLSELLQWMGDHALHRCKTDSDFPNCLVPQRALRVQDKLRELRAQGRWCLPASEYKTIVKAIDSRYERLEDMQRHTQLLHSWMELHHHYRHMHLKKTVVLDATWVMQLIGVVCCCICSAEVTLAWGMLAHGAAVSATDAAVALITTPFPEAAKAPFSVAKMQEVDPFGLCTRGILTLPIASELLRETLKQKNFTLKSTDAMLELLETYDLLMRGSRLKFSSFYSSALRERSPSQSSNPNLSSSNLSTVAQHADPTDLHQQRLRRHRSQLHDASRVAGGAGGPFDADNDGNDVAETFYLIPACFQAPFPSALAVHLTPLLFGPTHRFSLNMVPTQFFPRFVSRVSRYAQKLYLGPAVHSPTHHIENARMWKGAVWIVSSQTSRALVRMVGHTLFVTFHDHAEDSDFYQGLRHVVQSIVAESPGAHCTETLLCRSMASAIDAMGRDVESESTSRRIAEDEDLQDDDDGRDDDDDANEYNADLGDGSGGAGAFWVLLDDNLNSLERIKEREQGALKSARGGPPPPDSGHSNRDDAVPMTRSRSAGLSSKKLMRKVSQDILMLDEVAVRLEKALKLIQRGRQLADRDRGAVLEGRGMDALVDALAQA